MTQQIIVADNGGYLQITPVFALLLSWLYGQQDTYIIHAFSFAAVFISVGCFPVYTLEGIFKGWNDTL